MGLADKKANMRLSSVFLPYFLQSQDLYIQSRCSKTTRLSDGHHTRNGHAWWMFRGDWPHSVIDTPLEPHYFFGIRPPLGFEVPTEDAVHSPYPRLCRLMIAVSVSFLAPFLLRQSNLEYLMMKFHFGVYRLWHRTMVLLQRFSFQRSLMDYNGCDTHQYLNLAALVCSHFVSCTHLQTRLL